MMLVMELPGAVPPRVKLNPKPVMVSTLLRMMFPVLPVLIKASAPKVSSPSYVDALAELFIKAPPLLTPVPLMVKGLALAAVGVIPLRSNAAPERTVTLPLVKVPSA